MDTPLSTVGELRGWPPDRVEAGTRVKGAPLNQKEGKGHSDVGLYFSH